MKDGAGPAIAVRGLAKSYGAVPAVRGISFEVAAGEVVAILGPNGAGKTTTVEILEGYRSRDAGSVSVLGFDPASQSRRLKERIGIVLQKCGLPPDFRVAELVEQYHGFYPRPRAVGEVLELVGLEGKGSSLVRKLSGGEQRRLDFALALVGDPDLIFLDEPTTGFDPAARRQSWDAVRNLKSLGKAILLTTHYMDEAQRLADRVIVIAAGEIVAEGPPDGIGGRRTAATRISFEPIDGLDLDELRALCGPDVELVDGLVVLRTTDPASALHALTSRTLGLGLGLHGLEVAQPSLEDVYLELVGDSRREAMA